MPLHTDGMPDRLTNVEMTQMDLLLSDTWMTKEWQLQKNICLHQDSNPSQLSRKIAATPLR